MFQRSLSNHDGNLCAFGFGISCLTSLAYSADNVRHLFRDPTEPRSICEVDDDKIDSGIAEHFFIEPRLATAGRGKVIPAPNAARRGPVGLKVRRQQRGNGPFSHLATKRIPNTLSPNSRFALRRS